MIKEQLGRNLDHQRKERQEQQLVTDPHQLTPATQAVVAQAQSMSNALEDTC